MKNYNNKLSQNRKIRFYQGKNLEDDAFFVSFDLTLFNG